MRAAEMVKSEGSFSELANVASYPDLSGFLAAPACGPIRTRVQGAGVSDPDSNLRFASTDREIATSLLGLITSKTLKIPSFDASIVARAVTAPFRNTSALAWPFVSIHSIDTPPPMNGPTEAK